MVQESAPKGFLSDTLNTATTFVALYLTTLFSLDTWAAARGSPFRAPTAADYTRPASRTPYSSSSASYRSGGNGGGNGGNSGGGGGRPVGRIGGGDSRPPINLVGAASCGACMG